MNGAAEPNNKNGGVFLSVRQVGAAVFSIFAALLVAGFTIYFQSRNAIEHEADQERANLNTQLKAISTNVDVLKTTVDLKMTFFERQLADRMLRYESETNVQNKRIDTIVEHLSNLENKGNKNK